MGYTQSTLDFWIISTDKTDFGAVVNKANKAFKKMGKEGTKVAKALGDTFQDFGFTLPLLFGAQAASDSIKSLIDPALELVGVQKTYNDLLAIRFLPTALKQLDNVLALGDAWLVTSEAERTQQGDLLLTMKQMTDFVNYASSMATTFASLGEMIPTAELTLFGLGTEITGRSIGALTGFTIAATTAAIDMSTELGRTQVNLSGFGTTTSDVTSQALAKFIGVVKEANSQHLPTFLEKLTETKNDLAGPDSLQSALTGVTKDGKPWNVDILVALTKEDPRNVKKWLDELPAEKTVKINLMLSFLSGLGTVIDSVTKTLHNWGIPGFQTGGIMPHTGLAMLHAGEVVTSAGQASSQNINSGGPVINIQASINNDYDVRRLADQLSKYWVNDMERISKGRGMI